jgi:hypothetical protein
VLGAPGDIFFPELDEPRMLTFSTIADALLRDMGYTPVPCLSEDEARDAAARRSPEEATWPVYYFASETSGEKPFEEFFTSVENVDHERFAALGVIAGTTRNDVASIRSTVADLHTLFSSPELTKGAIVETLTRLVPSFQHVETGKSLDAKM